MYKNFINICIGVLSIFGTNLSIDDNMNKDLKEFLQDKFPDVNDDIDKLESNIELMEIKNYVRSKIPTFNLKLYVLVYNSLIDFPRLKFNYEAITTNNFFANVHNTPKLKFIFIILTSLEKYLVILTTFVI